MNVTLPERTVEAWIAAYLGRTFQNVVLWSPTQRGPTDYDLAVGLPSPGKLFVLESKAPQMDPPAVGHGFRLDPRQLYNYLRHPQLRNRTYYVLPCPPFAAAPLPAVPVGGLPITPLVPPPALTRIGSEKWMRIVAASDLWPLLGLKAAVPAKGKPWWPPKAAPPLGAPPAKPFISLNCTTWPKNLPYRPLADFVSDLRQCKETGLVVHPRDPDLSVIQDADQSLGEIGQVVYVPQRDLPGFKP